MNKKELTDYNNKYGEVPKDFSKRFNYILDTFKIPGKELAKLRESAKKLLRAKWTELNFVIYYLPKATPRPRSGRNGTFYVKGAKDNNNAFKEFIDTSEHTFDIITTPCSLLIDIYLPIPSSGMSKIEKILAELKLIRPVSKPDWDNVGKTYSDMIQKHLLLEDSLVIDGRTRKFYSAKPRIEIQIKYMNKYDCRYNKRKIESWGFYKDNEKALEKDSII